MSFRHSLFLSVFMAMAIGLVSPPSNAQSSNYYLGAGAGISLQSDADLTGTGVNTSIDTDLGWVGQLSIGRAYGNGWRTEIEAAYGKSDVDSISGAASSGGDISALSGMINGLYDFSVDGPLKPYVGIGLGIARINYNDVTPVGGSQIDDSDTVFAYQGIAGASYDLGNNLALTADYRYLATTDPKFRTDSGTSIDGEFSDHRVMVGLRWSFGQPKAKAKSKPTVIPVAQPAPAPKPMPTPKPAPIAQPPKFEIPRTYLVFFDWDRADLRPDSLAVIREAAANAEKGSVTRLISTGHADRSGTDTYNMGLSKRRAQSVTAELIRLGFPSGGIEIVWKGEREPLVPTGDGVREPQNRRVEIVFK